MTNEQLLDVARFDRARRAACPSVRGGRRKTLRYNYVQVGRGSDWRGRDVTIVHVAVRLDRNGAQVVKEVAWCDLSTGLMEARDIDYRHIAGWIVSWSHRDIHGTKDSAPGDVVFAKPVDPRIYKIGEWDGRTSEFFPCNETVNPEALAGTRYRYSQYDAPGQCVGLVCWLMLFRQNPAVEMLAKAGLARLVTPGGIRALRDRRVLDWCRRHADEIKRAKCCGIADIIYAARHGMSISDAAAYNAFVNFAKGEFDRVRIAIWNRKREARGDGYGATLKPSYRLAMDYDRLRKTLPKWGVEIREYARYLEYAVRIGLDWRNEGTLYPPVSGGRDAFMARLEACEAEYARQVEAERRRQEREKKRAKAERRAKVKSLLAERAVELERFQRSLERVKTLTGSGYGIVLAKSQAELRAEGKKMHNCVGSGTYGEAVVLGDSLIVMLKDAQGCSYCDIEIDRKAWKVRQCYLKRNQPAPPEIHALAEQIAKTLKAESRRRRKKAA